LGKSFVKKLACDARINKIGIKVPLNVEQVYHTDTNLSFDMSRTMSDFSVELNDMERNLKKYIAG
jgi:hypothetical protein